MSFSFVLSQPESVAFAESKRVPLGEPVRLP